MFGGGIVGNMVGKSFDNWIDGKWHNFTSWFWHGLDEVSMLALVACLLLSMFGLEFPKKAAWAVVAIYMTAQFFRMAF